MKISKIKVSLISILLLMLSTQLLAQSNRVVNSDLRHFERVYQAAVQPGSARAPARYTTRIQGFGRVRFIFDEIKVSTVIPEIIDAQGFKNYDTNPVVLLKGRAKTANGWEIATAALARQNSGLRLVTSFTTRRRVTSAVNSVTLEHKNVSNPALVAGFQRTNATTLRNSTCATDLFNQSTLNINQSYVPLNQSEPQPTTGLATARELELSLHADASYIASHGTTAQDILARVNEVEAIYEAQFELSFVINRLQFDSTLNLGSSQADTMLDNFQTHLANRDIFDSADLFHLFTGTNMFIGGSDGVIGIAYQGTINPPDPGVVCRYGNSFTVGISERLSSTSAGLLKVTLAHEMGHNFGCEHAASGIMVASAASPLPELFAVESEVVINSHLENFGSCLAEVGESPDPTPTPSDEPDDDDPPGGSTGVGSGGGVNAVPVNLTASLNRQGQFSATMSLEEAPPEDCSMRLVTGKNRRRIEYRGTNLAEEAISSVLEFTYTASVNRKTRTFNRRGRSQKVFVAAFLDCPSAADSGFSQVIRIRSDLVRSGVSTSVKGFAEHLQCRVQGSC